MQIGVTSSIIGNPSTTLDELVDEVRQAEADGFAF